MIPTALRSVGMVLGVSGPRPQALGLGSRTRTTPGYFYQSQRRTDPAGKAVHDAPCTPRSARTVPAAIRLPGEEAAGRALVPPLPTGPGSPAQEPHSRV